MHCIAKEEQELSNMLILLFSVTRPIEDSMCVVTKRKYAIFSWFQPDRKSSPAEMIMHSFTNRY